MDDFTQLQDVNVSHKQTAWFWLAEQENVKIADKQKPITFQT